MNQVGTTAGSPQNVFIPEGLGLWDGVSLKPRLSGMLYLSLKGAKQGEFKSSSDEKGHAGKMKLIGVNHALNAPRDASSGMSIGKRQHHPIRIAFMNDRTVPLFYNALTNNETITQWKLEVVTPVHVGMAGTKEGKSGGFTVQYTIELKNAYLERIDCFSVEPSGLAFVVGFTYQEIIWTWVDGGITGDDKWEQSGS